MKSPNRVRVTAFLFAAVLTGGVASASTSRGRAAPASHFLITVTPSGQGRLSQRSLVEIVSRSGGLERVVAPASSAYPYQAAFSPDGSRIAWAASDGVHVEN